MPLFIMTDQENHMACDILQASGSSRLAVLGRENGLKRSNRYSMTATKWIQAKINTQSLGSNGRRNCSRKLCVEGCEEMDGHA